MRTDVVLINILVRSVLLILPPEIYDFSFKSFLLFDIRYIDLFDIFIAVVSYWELVL